MDMALRCVIIANGDTPVSVAAEVVALTLFDLGAQAVSEEHRNDGLVLLAGFPDENKARAALEHVTTNHADLISRVSIDDRSTSDWVATQQEGLEPTTVGPWHIRGPWETANRNIDPKYDIVIDPGAAFGHGGHPSTRLAMELLLRVSSSIDHVVDIGTGTGVIAILAARLGHNVTAVEHDPSAAAVAQQNISLNSMSPSSRVDKQITLTIADGADAIVAPESLVVANVTLDVQRGIAPRFQHVGRLLISGILCRQVGQLRALYPKHEAVTIRTFGEWAALELVRSPGGIELKR